VFRFCTPITGQGEGAAKRCSAMPSVQNVAFSCWFSCQDHFVHYLWDLLYARDLPPPPPLLLPLILEFNRGGNLVLKTAPANSAACLSVSSHFYPHLQRCPMQSWDEPHGISCINHTTMQFAVCDTGSNRFAPIHCAANHSNSCPTSLPPQAAPLQRRHARRRGRLDFRDRWRRRGQPATPALRSAGCGHEQSTRLLRMGWSRDGG
jgi:hypothetical protein